MDIAEIIKQSRRMCEAQPTCIGCQLWGHWCNPMLPDNNIDSMAAVISAWSTSHPEPRYPTWAEWWATLPEVVEKITAKGIKIERSPLGRSMLLFDPSDCRAMVFAINSSIPSDLAKKLGIKPINQAKE